MPAFDAVIKTKTRVPINADSFQPGMGKLGPGALTEEALIHGNQKLAVTGHVLENIGGSYALKIAQTSFTQVGGDVKAQYQANFHLAVTGTTREDHFGTSNYNFLGDRIEKMITAHNTFNVGPKTSIFVAPLTETHASPRQIQEPTVRFNIIGQDFTLQNNSFTITPMSMALYGFLLQATGAQVQASTDNIQAMLLNLQLNGANLGANGLTCNAHIGYVKTAPAFVWAGFSLGGNEFM